MNELRERIEAADLPEQALQSGRPRALAAGETAARRRRARRHPHLPGVAGRAALVEGDRGQPRHQARPQGARRRPLRPRKGQGPDPRVPGGAQAQPRLARPDPLLRRPARGRQDQPRPLDREGAGARVRADLGRRRPRRGGDPRPPPHLHRGAAGDDRPRPARRRLPQPRLHDRRDRQDGRRLPRRPRLGDAGGARPGPERLLPRPLPRPRVRPLRGRLHRHRQRPRHDPGAAAGPDGDDRTGRLHGRGEAPHRPPLPGPAPDRRQRPQALPDRVRRRRPDRDHRGVHPRGRRPQPRAPDRHRLPQSRPRRRRGQGKGKVRVSGKKARELLGRRRVFAEQRRRTKVPGVATGLAWTPTGGDVLFIEATAMPGVGQADDHRPARRRDEGVGAGGALLGPRPLGARSTRSWARTGSPSTTSTSTSRPGRCPRTGPRPGWR